MGYLESTQALEKDKLQPGVGIETAMNNGYKGYIPSVSQSGAS